MWGATRPPHLPSQVCAISTHTPHAGCDTGLPDFQPDSPISTHTPHVGCDCVYWRFCFAIVNFNSHTPCGVRPETAIYSQRKRQFQLTHPMWGATSWDYLQRYISQYFNSHTPCGVRLEFLAIAESYAYFNSHTPCGVRHLASAGGIELADFNSHTPCGVRRSTQCYSVVTIYFNSHTPCGVRQNLRRCVCEFLGFQLTHPMWGATFPYRLFWLFLTISTHTPHVGCDYVAGFLTNKPGGFQLTHPMWGAT